MTSGFGHYGWAIIVFLVAFFAFLLYRRGKRLIGHQRFQERRMIIRTVIFGVLILFLLASYARRPDPLLGYGSAAAGFVLGIVIGLLALRFTQMGRDEDGVWYVPNTYLGIGLIALLVGRFVYEYVVVFPQIRKQAQMAAAQASAHPNAPVGAHMSAVASQPILHAVLFIVLGYYLVYYLGILLRARGMEPEPSGGQ